MMNDVDVDRLISVIRFPDDWSDDVREEYKRRFRETLEKERGVVDERGHTLGNRSG